MEKMTLHIRHIAGPMLVKKCGRAGRNRLKASVADTRLYQRMDDASDTQRCVILLETLIGILRTTASLSDRVSFPCINVVQTEIPCCGRARAAVAA
jgi:hypothetical protein